MAHATLFLSAVGIKVNYPFVAHSSHVSASFPNRVTTARRTVDLYYVHHPCIASRHLYANRSLLFQRERMRSIATVRCSSSDEQQRNGGTSARQEKKSAAQLVRDAQTVYTSEKPPWCQPWTIVSTGMAIIAVAWKLFGVGYFSAVALVVTFAIFLWWYAFLILYPQQKLHGTDY